MKSITIHLLISDSIFFILKSSTIDEEEFHSSRPAWKNMLEKYWNPRHIGQNLRDIISIISDKDGFRTKKNKKFNLDDFCEASMW